MMPDLQNVMTHSTNICHNFSTNSISQNTRNRTTPHWIIGALTYPLQELIHDRLKETLEM